MDAWTLSDARIISGDEPYVRPTGTATFSDKHVGTSKPATVNVSLTGS